MICFVLFCCFVFAVVRLRFVCACLVVCFALWVLCVWIQLVLRFCFDILLFGFWFMACALDCAYPELLFDVWFCVCAALTLCVVLSFWFCAFLVLLL